MDNRMNNSLKSLLMAGFVMMAILFTGREAEAANRIPEDNIVIDYATQSLQVTTTDDEVMIAFPVVRVEENEITGIQIKKWDIYDYTYMVEQEDETKLVTVDLSPISITKGGYVAVKTNAAQEAYLIHFGGVHTKLSVAYDASEGKVTIVDRADEGNECESFFEYRTQYGNWMDYDVDETNLQHYEQQGATLYFREKSGYDDGDEYISQGRLSARAIADKVGVVEADPNYILYEAINTFSGKELKVKIARRKDGPSASFNYAKRKITVKKNNEYRMDMTEDFQSTPAGKALEVNVGNDAGILEVRTAEVEGKRYMPPSKITRYEYPATRSLTVSDDENGYVGRKAGKLAIVYNEKTKKIECVSSDQENTYLVYVRKAGQVCPVAGSAVLTTIKPAASASAQKVVTLVKSKIPSGSEIYVAYAADTKGKQWATEPILLGKVE